MRKMKVSITNNKISSPIEKVLRFQKLKIQNERSGSKIMKSKVPKVEIN